MKKTLLFCKYTLIVCFVIIIFSACEKPKGTVSGNAYWNYNKYVGDKPDAGTNIYLFSEDTSKPVLKAVCGVDGNFQIDNVETGDYMLVAESKNTNGSKSDIFYEIKSYNKAEYLGFSLRDIDSNLFKLAFDFYFKKMKYDIGPNPMLSSEEKMKYYDTVLQVTSSANRYADSLINKIPKTSKFLNELAFVGFRKIKCFKIKVEKNKKTVQVIDFGNTYM